MQYGIIPFGYEISQWSQKEEALSGISEIHIAAMNIEENVKFDFAYYNGEVRYVPRQNTCRPNGCESNCWDD